MHFRFVPQAKLDCFLYKHWSDKNCVLVEFGQRGKDWKKKSFYCCWKRCAKICYSARYGKCELGINQEKYTGLGYITEFPSGAKVTWTAKWKITTLLYWTNMPYGIFGYATNNYRKWSYSSHFHESLLYGKNFHFKVSRKSTFDGKK